MTHDLATLVARVQRLEEEVSRLKALAPTHNGMAVSAPDADFLAQLLPAITDRMGSIPFTCAEIGEDAVLAPLLAGRNAKGLGKLFGRTAGAAFNGYAVHRDPRERNAWKVQVAI